MFPGCTSVVTQIPLQRPIFVRERSARLYRTLSYILGRLLANMALQVVYPTILAVVVFFAVGFPISLEGFGLVLSAMVLLNMNGAGLGYMSGCVCNEAFTAYALANTYYFLCWGCSGGMLNLRTLPLYLRLASHIVPARYAIEIMMRVIVADRQDEGVRVLEEYGFTYGYLGCYAGLFACFFGYLGIAVFAIVFNNRNL